MRVLIVEDDPMIGETLRAALTDAAYAAAWVKDGLHAIELLSYETYDLVLLDLGLPGRSGMEVLKEVRKSGNKTPILLVTAQDGVSDRIIGLDQGADDYLVKPFDISELMARMRAVIRRHQGAASMLLTNSEITLNPATHEASDSNGTVFPLSKREFALLQALMLRPGNILSRRQLEDKVYPEGDEVESNAIEFLIYSLRKKLGNSAIKNIRGVGWMVSRSP